MQAVRRPAARSPNDPWWDDKRTPGVIEGRDEILRRRWSRRGCELTRSSARTRRMAVGPAAPARRCSTRCSAATACRARSAACSTAGPCDMPGGSAIVDANGWNASRRATQVDWAPSMRMVVDLGDLDHSRWVNQTGASGHAFARTTTTRSTRGSRARPTPGRSPSRRSAGRGGGAAARAGPLRRLSGDAPAGPRRRVRLSGRRCRVAAVGSRRQSPRPGVTTASTRTSCPSAGSGPGTSSSSPTTATTRAPGARRRSARS